MLHPFRPSPRGDTGVRRRCAALLAAIFAAGVIVTPVAFAATPSSVQLGTVNTFAVLAGSAVTNTGPSVISGDLGLSPGSAISGFPPGLVNAGTVHATDGVAAQAQADLTTAYNDAAGRSSTATISADLAGSTLTPGVYTAATSLGLSGALTLNAQGNPDAVFIFQAGTSLTVGSGAIVTLIGGAQACNVFWQVGSSATIGSGAAFVGNIMALTSISMVTGATLNGRALARNGAVTLDTNTITRATCAAGTAGGPTSTTPTTAAGSGSSGTTTGTGTATTTTGTTTGKGGTTGKGSTGGNSGSATGTPATKKHKHKRHTKPAPVARKAKPKPKLTPKPKPKPTPASHKPPAFTG